MKIMFTERELMEGARIAKDSELFVKCMDDNKIEEFKSMSDTEILSMLRKNNIKGIEGITTFKKYYSEQYKDVIYEFEISAEYVTDNLIASHDAIIEVLQMINTMIKPFVFGIKKLYTKYIGEIKEIFRKYDKRPKDEKHLKMKNNERYKILNNKVRKTIKFYTEIMGSVTKEKIISVISETEKLNQSDIDMIDFILKNLDK